MYKTKAHSKFSLLVHLVFATKYRYKWLADKYISDKVKNVIKGVCKSIGTEVVEIETDKDHLHLLISYYPNISLTN